MKVLVTGAKGQLGTDLVKIFKEQFIVYGLGRAELDITNLEQTKQVIYELQPDIIVHAAAYTAVDLAETDEEKAYRVNGVGTRNLAICAEQVGAKMCYISTDYVFDGASTTPYREYDNTNPLSVYGKSKRAGELLVQSLCSKYFIVRTSWVYGIHGNNFVKTMMKLAKEREHIKVVNDQYGSPTYTVDLACFLKELIITEKYGIYHSSNTGICTWYEFAKAIFEEIDAKVILEPCSTEEFPRPAPRPMYSAMEHLSIKINDFSDLRDWRLALKEYIKSSN
ncbi:dTDP-4-dehydrorhamnose reductase [Paenibacillus elgii]|uniref:dTDP-4-dehydrorhamnose reductase n=1 Tax=Paenibacillus elgii TaxID=189691 RepID=UPI0013CF99F0|nr:dTDP-4-dehydrorhamnose reductase [Paenibacillus elgii]